MKAYCVLLGYWLFGLLVYWRRGGLRYACDVMRSLNVWTRRQRVKSDAGRWVYQLKNRLVKMLYESGYCTDVHKEVQKSQCWECSGSGEDQWDDGAPCWKCAGSGVYRSTELYSFQFTLTRHHLQVPWMGKRYDMRLALRRPWITKSHNIYRWHQPASLVNWPVQIADDAPALDYNAPDDSNMIIALSERDALIVSFAVWWALALRGRAPRMPLLEPWLPRFDVRRIQNVFSQRRVLRLSLYMPLLFLRVELLGGRSVAASLPSIPTWHDWDGGSARFRDHDWLGVAWHRDRGVRIDLFGWHVPALVSNLWARLQCAFHGHVIAAAFDGCLQCQRCDLEPPCDQPDCTRQASVDCLEPVRGTWREAMADVLHLVRAFRLIEATGTLWQWMRHRTHQLHSYYCHEHARKAGFCPVCGRFCAGSDPFDSRGYCDNCLDEIRADADTYDQDDYGMACF